MGKRGRGRGRGGRGAGSSSTSNGRHDQRGQRSDYDTIITRNDDFESYYRSQGIVADDEWETFIQKCIDPLPLTFRITASRAASAAVNEHVEKFFVPYLSNVEYEGVKQSPPKPLQWYPNHLAWQLDVSKHVVRKTQEFSKFQQFLVHETDAGNVSRQEAVSMIPPLLLDVQPQHFVLDCCAAPGSKTTQLLEALHAQSPDASNPHASSMPAGLLVANDSDAKRCHMLVHQSLNRIGSPNTMVTNLDATAIPNIRITHKESGQPRTLLFDRILCDVPCSGDGTMRKNPNIWKTWKPADGLGLHGLQLRILTRALQMLKPGGRVCYSTCSSNPIENEAVVSAALEAHPDLSLVDVADRLPGLHRRNGLTKWLVYDKYLNKLETPSDFKADYRSDPKAKAPAATCWPNGKEEERNLNRCLRLYPHLQNTGGFFVALLEKAAKPERGVNGSKAAASADVAGIADDVPSASTKRSASPAADAPAVKRLKEDATASDVQSDSDSTSGPVGQAKATEGGGRPFNEEPYCFLSPGDEQVKICLNFFDLSSDFPSENLFVRNTSGQALRSIYLTSPVIRNIISLNDYGKMRLVSCGVKILTRQDSGATGVYPCRWRILQDGLTLLTEYMSDKRKVKANLSSLRAMMVEPYPHFDKIEQADFRKQIDALEPGSCICEFTAGEEAGGRLESSIQVPLWKAPNSLCLMVEKLEKKALSMRIFGEDLTGHGQSKPKDGKTKPAGAELQQTAEGDIVAPVVAADPVEETIAEEELGQDA